MSKAGCPVDELETLDAAITEPILRPRFDLSRRLACAERRRQIAIVA